MPALAISIFSFLAIGEKLIIINEINQLKALVQLSVKIGELSHELQKERGLSAGFISSKGGLNVADLAKQWQQTDRNVDEFKNAVLKFKSHKYENVLDSNFNSANQKLSSIDTHRQAVSQLEISETGSASYYTSTIANILEISNFASTFSSNGEVSRFASAYASFLQAKERSGRERAILSAVFTVNQFTPNSLNIFLQNLSAQQVYFDDFFRYATPKQKSLFESTLQGDAATETLQFLQTAIENSNAISLGKDPSVWFKEATDRIENLRIIEISLANDLLLAQEKLLSETHKKIAIYIVLLIIALLLPMLPWGWGLLMLTRTSLKLLRIKRQTETAINNYTNELRIQNDHFDALFDLSLDAMINIDAQGIVLAWNRRAEEMFGIPKQQAIGIELANIIIPPALRDKHRNGLQNFLRSGAESLPTKRFEVVGLHANGKEIPLELTVTGMLKKNRVIFHSFLRDLTERRQHEAQIEHLAYFDELTNLPNRLLLIDRLRQIIALNKRKPQHSALLQIDLDHFKELNDAWGHDQGDSLLKMVALKLHDCVREEDTLARLGGDDFLILLVGLSATPDIAQQQATAVSEKIRSCFRSPFLLHNHDQYEYHTTVSIGICLFGGGANLCSDELLKRADMAMYQAKLAGRNSVRFFEDSMSNEQLERFSLGIELQLALERKQLILYLQPQYNSEGNLLGAEALIRWQHPSLGLISPTMFIPLAEKLGLILSIGHWVLEQACGLLQKWASIPELRDLILAVNVSASQFSQDNFVNQVLSLIEKMGIPPDRLKLEITESLLMTHAESIIHTMQQLKARGINFSLDDFGTGYSSLSYLKRLPIDQLKIDQSFVRGLPEDQNDAVIVRTIIALGRSLGLQVIAEGVETSAQRDFLIHEDCLDFQGYFYGRPVPEAEFIQQYAKNNLTKL
jgi:diguanylate cyclase (GGDEF)-like protein/PAS domain S-box-containing protein